MIKKLLANKPATFSLVGFFITFVIELVLGIVYRVYNLSIIWSDLFHTVVILAGGVCFLIFCCSIRSIILKTIGSVIALMVILWIVTLASFIEMTHNFYFRSPEGKRTLIAVESRHNGRYCCRMYARRYLLFKEELNNYYVCSELNAFADDAYDISWIDDNEVHFLFNLGDAKYVEIMESKNITFRIEKEFESEPIPAVIAVLDKVGGGFEPKVKGITFKVNLKDTLKRIQ